MEETRTNASATTRTQGRGAYDDVLLNRYRIMSASGTGGFGTVLTCWDTRLQRRVAIKRLPLAGSDASSTLAEALSEARTSSMLSHPNIVTVYDFEVDGPYAYLVMEYVDGMTLSELLHRVEGGVLTHDEAACLVQSVASALGYAHENGVLHMDLKPSNIMIDHSGTCKLCDFGMATLASATGFGGARGGTVGYMPPEQIEGTIVDERTDVFSLAVVVWQALLGSNPFAAPTAEASLKLINKGPVAPSKLNPALAGMAEEALLGALAPHPSQRIPSVETLAKELVFALGDPAAGAVSLRGLISQTPEATATDVDDWEGERLPLGVSHPWLPGVFVRMVAAATTAYAGVPVLSPLIARMDPSLGPVALAVCVAATLLWPPLGSALVVGGACATLGLSGASTASLLLAIVGAALFVVWWALSGMTSKLSTPALLLPACLASPLPGVALAGYALGPGSAFCTGCVSWLVGKLWPVLTASGFAPADVVNGLLWPLVTLPNLVAALGCGCAALLCSTLTWRGPETSHAITGQIVGCLALVASQLVAARMENGGIWPEPTWDNTGIAVVLGLLVCLACVLHGPRTTAFESEV